MNAKSAIKCNHCLFDFVMAAGIDGICKYQHSTGPHVTITIDKFARVPVHAQHKSAQIVNEATLTEPQ